MWNTMAGRLQSEDDRVSIPSIVMGDIYDIAAASRCRQGGRREEVMQREKKDLCTIHSEGTNTYTTTNNKGSP